jgi:DNA invertase Pin-like site-specific DNA recombinase
MRIGYARVSTRDQNLELQVDALNKVGCQRIFADKLSGAQVERSGLKEALSHLREATPWWSGNSIGSGAA